MSPTSPSSMAASTGPTPIRVATKCGLWADGRRDLYDLRPGSIRREVDESRWRLGVEVLCYSPMQSGPLTGSFSHERVGA
jgi:aryl-alcohol dehydrogenase-like predicted oxidoreductase